MPEPAPDHYRGKYFLELLELVVRAGGKLPLSYYNGDVHVRDVTLLTNREQTRIYIECDDAACACHRNNRLHTSLSGLRGCSVTNTYDNFRDPETRTPLSTLVRHVAPDHELIKALREAHQTLRLPQHCKDAAALISRLRAAKPTTIDAARPLALSVVGEFYSTRSNGQAGNGAVRNGVAAVAPEARP